jgi:adenylate kinase
MSERTSKGHERVARVKRHIQMIRCYQFQVALKSDIPSAIVSAARNLDKAITCERTS